MGGTTTTCFNDHDDDQTVDLLRRPRAVRLGSYQQTKSTKNTVIMSGLATKQQSLKIFEKLKTKPANKVSASLPFPLHRSLETAADTGCIL